jgi:predicted nuclease with TOPRIM domain
MDRDGVLEDMFLKRLNGLTDTQISSSLDEMPSAERVAMFADLDIMERVNNENAQLKEENAQLKEENAQLMVHVQDILGRVKELETRINAYEEKDAQLVKIRVALQNIGYEFPNSATRSIHVRRAIYQMV